MRIDPGEETLIGRALGLDDEQSAIVVATLSEQGWLQHGVVTAGAAMAARWGVELHEALLQVAGGRRLGAELSDYELRVSAEEAEGEVAEAWGRSATALREELLERRVSTQRDIEHVELVGMDQVSRSVAYVDFVQTRALGE